VVEEDADWRPEGFNNTIRWNVGHILMATENSCSAAKGLSEVKKTVNGE